MGTITLTIRSLAEGSPRGTAESHFPLHLKCAHEEVEE